MLVCRDSMCGVKQLREEGFIISHGFRSSILTDITTGSSRARRGVARTHASSHFHRAGSMKRCGGDVVVTSMTSSFFSTRVHLDDPAG